MKLIAGLGNPGEKYKNTRHNVGFMVANRLLSTINESGEWKENKKFNAEIYIPQKSDAILVKPQTFMNQSGYAVKLVSSFYKVHPEEIYIIHDDLDISLGEYKIQKGVGPKVHYGIASVEGKLESKYFWRVRVGVENREKNEDGSWKTENFTKGEEYVLQNFTDKEIGIINEVTKEIVRKLNSILTG